MSESEVENGGEFRWPPPPSGVLVPKDEGPTDYAQVAAVIRWFARERIGCGDLPADSPLARWCRAAEAVEPVTDEELAAAKPIISGDAERDAASFAGIADLQGAKLLAWSIRVVETRARGEVRFDRSFQDDLLVGDLSPGDQRGPVMPAGVGTLYTAARCLQADGGYVRVRGRGQKAAGRDIEWKPVSGGCCWIERKDRAFAAAAKDTAATLMSKVEAVVVGATEKMQAPTDVGKVVIVGATWNFESALALVNAFGNLPAQFDWSSKARTALPDGICLEFVGSNIQGTEVRPMHLSHFVENRASSGKPGWASARPALLAAYGSRRSIPA